jgi:hypothetical protein
VRGVVRQQVARFPLRAADHHRRADEDEDGPGRGLRAQVGDQLADDLRVRAVDEHALRVAAGEDAPAVAGARLVEHRGPLGDGSQRWIALIRYCRPACSTRRTLAGSV